ncbi:MAG TPA: PA14 domain-containing protein [Pirellulales bacterium]|nr:PA14 domain-containing protein [Pirellulales bacterium]
MSDVFDPYRKWLGIPPAEQPPHHYRLLGVGLFEDDADTISIAADRQMAHVRTFQTGPHSALSQKLLNELAAARLALLDPNKKAAYDEQLRAKLAAAAGNKSGAGQGGDGEKRTGAGQGRGEPSAPKPQAVPRPPSSPHVPVLLAAGQGRGGESGPTEGFVQAPDGFVPPASSRLSRKRSRQEPAVWLGLATAALALAAVTYFVYPRSTTEPQPTTVSVRPTPAEPGSPKQPPPETESAADAKTSVEAKPEAPPPPTIVEGEPSSFPPATPEATTRRASGRPDRPSRKPPREERAGNSNDDPASEPNGDREARQPPEPSASEPAPPKPPKSLGEKSLGDLAKVADRPELARAHRDAPPEGKALTTSAGRFAQQYNKEITDAKTPEARLKVALKIFNEARDGRQAADLRYVMLDNVGKEALAQGRVGLAYRVAVEVARQFDVDPLAIRLKMLDASGKMAQTPDACAIGALEALSVADRAATDGKLDLANKAAGQAAVFARKTKDKELIAQIDRRKAALREQSTHGTAYKKALGDLKKTADDSEANLAAGKYEVLVLGNWQEGLEKLAASGDATLREIARLEALARVDLSQWAPLAAAWWALSQAEADEFFKPLCQLQAKYCYLRARRTGRAGEVPAEAAQQLASVSGYPMSRLVAGVAARYYDGADFQQQRVERAESAIDFFYGQGSPDPSVQTNHFSARWTGFIKPPAAGRYLIVTCTNDSVRLWVDGKQVLNRWRQSAGWQQVELELSDELHSFRLEYNETFDVAFAMFGWTLAAFPDDQHHQWSPIDALYYDPESPFDLPE